MQLAMKTRDFHLSFTVFIFLFSASVSISLCVHVAHSLPTVCRVEICGPISQGAVWRRAAGVRLHCRKHPANAEGNGRP